jgi:hypothetical protein
MWIRPEGLATYGQSLQAQYFFFFPLTSFTTAGSKNWSTSCRFSSRDIVMS